MGLIFITQPHSSWTHRLARLFVRPFVGSPITPNHLTTARLVSGVVACAVFMVGRPEWNWWGGWLWLASCFLDRADGELARLAKASSPGGHLYDYYCDVVVNSLFFFSIGIGLRGSALGVWALALGVIGGGATGVASVLSEKLEEDAGSGQKAYSGVLGFDFDDMLYLFGPAAWVGAFPFLLVGAALGSSFIAALTWVRLRRQKARRARA